MPKWIERIELADTPDGGFWESRGWSVDGTAGVRAAILSHEQNADGSLALAGIAYGGARRIASVRVSVDNGDWMPASFAQGEPFALTYWQTEWTPPHIGDYGFSVRVYAVGSLTPGNHSLIVKVR
jgi:hypothetical protein